MSTTAPSPMVPNPPAAPTHSSPDACPAGEGTMLLVLPVPFRAAGGELLVEAQALNGLGRWADNFGRLVVAAPLVTSPPDGAAGTEVWAGLDGWAYADQVELVPLPAAYRLNEFFKSYRATRRRLAGLIARCQYLQFGIGGLIGDWAAVAAWEARSQGRPYAVHTDRVEHRASVIDSRGRGWRRRVKAAALAPWMRWAEASLVRGSAVALLHGADCFREYAPLARNARLIHDVHTKPEDALGGAAVAAKAERAEAGRAL